MKKIFLLPLLLILFFCFFGCMEKTPEEPSLIVLQSRKYKKTTDADLGGAVTDLSSDLPTEEQDDASNLQTMAVISLADNASVISDCLVDNGVFINGNIIMITTGGSFRFSGTLTDGQIWVSSDDPVNVVLDNASIHCSDMPAVEFHGNGKKYITLVGGSASRLSDGNGRANLNEDKKGIITYLQTLVITGEGSLELSANYSSAFAVGALKIIDATVTVTKSVDSALYSEDFVYLCRSALTCPDGTKSIRSNRVIIDGSSAVCGTITGKKVFIKGSTLTIGGWGDGINGEDIVSIENSAVNVDVTGDGIVSLGSAPNAVNGVVRCAESTIVIHDGDDGINARYLSFSSGILLSYGTGSQCNVSGGIEGYSEPTEIYFVPSVEQGNKLTFSAASVLLTGECADFLYIGVLPEENILYLNDEKYAVLA